MDVTINSVGHEQKSLIIIDEFVNKPDLLVGYAACAENGQFDQQKSDYYPGMRKPAPQAYLALFKTLLPLLKSTYGLNHVKQVDVIMSAFSLASTPINQLRPIQMLPHFDSPAENQFAVVHYLCEPEHGGTSFYRHRGSGYESISIDRLNAYRNEIKQQAIAEKLHLNPQYINGDTPLFERTYLLEAKMNRTVIYPSNLLHSGNIRSDIELSNDPEQGRLTISSFIVVSEGKK